MNAGRTMGRSSEFTQLTADIICRRIAEGESLRSICDAEDMPGKSTVFQWLEANELFADQYARARAKQAETYADDIVDIADNEPDSQKARVRIDARKWHSSKLAPKKYGDKLELAGDKENPLAVTVSGLKVVLGTKLDRILNEGTATADKDGTD